MRSLSEKVKSIQPSGIRKFFDLVLNAENIISLGVGEPDFSTPWHITEQAIYSLEKGQTSYTSNLGIMELRKEIAYYLHKRFQADYNPDNEVLITVGVSEGIDVALRTILNDGDEVIVPVPNFVCYQPLVTLAGGLPVPVDTSETGFILTKKQILEHLTPKTKAILICYPNNPTGAMISKEQLQDIIKIVKEKDLWLLSDEVYGELIYEGQPLSASTYIKDNLILLNGFSKAYAMTGWRIGYMACPKDVLSQAVKIHQYNTMCAPIMAQYAAVEALRNGKKEMEKMRRSYEERRNFFYNGLKEIGFDVLKPEGAFYIFPNIKRFGLKAEDFAMQLLQKAHVAVVPGNAFGEGIDYFIRCCYAASMEDLREALKRIKKFVNDL
ncbi:MAG: aminotransferase class I/II-fold pyridoxal phosphate-dependent enzyme [Candidatus Margulisbacteria bacterium]|nr:aminotransferase class I/II-fold pyridoxal phosphate-dependent enzyme [Candidatus Margulisiibacteriota bacterium]